MTGFNPKEKLTAYQRWEVAAFDEAEQAAARAAKPSSAPPQNADQSQQTPIVLPTAGEIERMHIEAHQQGYEAGHEEGIALARASTARINDLMTNLQLALKELDQHVADQLLATSVEIANQMMRQALRIRPELLLPVVREAVATQIGRAHV